MPLQVLGEAFRVRAGSYVAAISESLESTSLIMAGFVSVLYDDGTDDLIQIPDRVIGLGFTRSVAQHGFDHDGWVTGIGMFEVTGGSIKANMIYIEVGVWGDPALLQSRGMFAAGYLGSLQQPVFGRIETKDRFATWTFQGTVAEDATAGTHVCQLTIVPAAGNELQMEFGMITVGNTGTPQIASAFIDDGSNLISYVMNPGGNSNTTANQRYVIPQATQQTASILSSDVDFLHFTPFKVSGTMRLILQTSTVAVSVTQTFAITCRIRGSVPTITLSDNVGTPVLTTNTSAVF